MSAEEQRLAVVTGGSSGLGLAVAREFARRGFRVVTICRHPAPEFEGIAADLATATGRAEAVRELRQRGLTPTVLVNNAGIGAYAEWRKLPEAELRRVMELDFFAPVLLSCELLPELRRTRGTVINIASISALAPVACMGAYGAAKAAVWMFSESLRMEWRRFGVRVLTVSPGRIDTGFSERAPVCETPPPETPGRRGSSPESFAGAVFRAWRRGRRRLLYPGWYRGFIWFTRCFPALNEWGNRRIWGLDRDAAE